MTRPRFAGLAPTLQLSAAYVLPALALAWICGGQMLLGRVDAALAIPLLMPGALLIAWLIRGQSLRARARTFAAALLILAMTQLALHYGLAERMGGLQLVVTLLCGGVGCGVAAILIGRTGNWHAALRWPAMLLTLILWFVAGQALIGPAYATWTKPLSQPVAMITGLPLRWAGQGGDFAAMLEAGPSEAQALSELYRRLDVRVVDSLAGVRDEDALLVAHPRALAPEELVRLDALTARPRDIVILADALSSWPPAYPLGDPRNPPVTSLLTPLLDHWGIALAAVDPERAGDVDVFLDPAGQKLRLHSAGRFTRLPAGCATWGDRRVARCPIGRATVWLVGDADLLHESLWQSPIPDALWLRRSDNMKWLVSALGGPSRAYFEPIWIR